MRNCLAAVAKVEAQGGTVAFSLESPLAPSDRQAAFDAARARDLVTSSGYEGERILFQHPDLEREPRADERPVLAKARCK